MTNVKDIAFGEIAVHLKFVSPEQIEATLAEQAARNNPSQTLGDLLVSKGLMTKEQKERVLQHQAKLLKEIKMEDKLRREARMFAKFAVQKSMVTKDQAEQALKLWDLSEDKSVTMAQVMVSNAMLTEQQVSEISMSQKHIKMMCKLCQVRFTVVTVTQKTQVPCPKCGKMLEPTSKLETPKPQLTPRPQLLTQVFRTVKKTQQAGQTKRIKKVRCPICDESFQGELDKDNRTTCTGCGTSFEVM
jgi:protein-arginine kinase activator protein McsA